MNNNPKVSIIIPVYNGSNYLREAIDSALAQTYKNIEVIVVNDGSNDNGATEKIAKSYGDKIRYFYKENGGVASALNYGIQKMEGEYFSWLSHDDVYLPEKIETQINFLKQYLYPTIAYSDFEFIDSNSELLGIKHVRSFSKTKFRLSLVACHQIHGCSLLIPRICFEKIGNFNEKLKTVQDYELWFKFAKDYEFKHIQKILIKSRIHLNQDSFKLKNINMIETNNFYKWAIRILLSEDLRKFKKSYRIFFLLLLFLKLNVKGYKKAAKSLFKEILKKDNYLY